MRLSAEPACSSPSGVWTSGRYSSAPGFSRVANAAEAVAATEAQSTDRHSDDAAER